MTVRVVLVEDHALFRAGVRAELADLTLGDGASRASRSSARRRRSRTPSP